MEQAAALLTREGDKKITMNVSPRTVSRNTPAAVLSLCFAVLSLCYRPTVAMRLTAAICLLGIVKVSWITDRRD